MIKQTTLPCDCGHLDHVIVLTYWDDEDFTIHTQMEHELPWWRRVVLAFRYVFAPRSICKYGHWSTTMLNDPEKIKDLVAFLGDAYVKQVENQARYSELRVLMDRMCDVSSED